MKKSRELTFGFSARFHVLERFPVRLPDQLAILTEPFVIRPVLLVVIATAVEDHEATFARAEASLGLANCTLAFFRERSDGCHVYWIF